MLPIEIKVCNLKTASDCYDAIELIKADHRNYNGDLKHWLSGKQTHLKHSAAVKINALEHRAQRLDTSPDEA